MEKEMVYVGVGRRLTAYLIDLVMVWSLMQVMEILESLLFFSMGADREILNQRVLLHWTAKELINWIMAAGYFVACTCLMGGTPGKLVMLMRVVNTEGERPDVWSVIYRETVGRFLSSFFFLGYLLMFAGEEHAALHDRLSDTRVVQWGMEEPEIPYSAKEEASFRYRNGGTKERAMGPKSPWNFQNENKWP